LNRIERLIGAMTLEEKLGQLTMTASSYAVTGPVIAGDSTEAIKAGTIGNLLNMVGAAHVREMQRLAVEESRLGIPLLIGFDVVHGHRILFPIPVWARRRCSIRKPGRSRRENRPRRPRPKAWP
jgi:beta-glucosidase